MQSRTLRFRYRRWRRRRRVRQHRSWWGTFSSQWPIILPLAVMQWFIGGLMAVIFVAAFALPIAFGTGLLALAFRRYGRERLCARCGYEMVWLPLAERDPRQRCPECGAFWFRRGGCVRGRRMMHPAIIAAGVLLVISPFAWLYLELRVQQLRGLHYRTLPTSLLIHAAVHRRANTYGVWNGLSERALSREQDLRLARGLLDRRLARGSLSSRDEESWLERAILADRLPPDFLERYFREMLNVRIDAPAHASPGSQIPLRIYIHDRGPISGNMHLFIAFEGYWTADDPTPLGRSETFVQNWQFGGMRQRFRRIDELEPGPGNPQALVTASAAGPLRVKARLWLLALPRSGGPVRNVPTNWTADGEPHLPGPLDDAVIWKHRIDVERVIQVDS